MHAYKLFCIFLLLFSPFINFLNNKNTLTFQIVQIYLDHSGYKHVI